MKTILKSTKLLLIPLFFLLSLTAFSQISGGEIKPDKEKRVKGEKRVKNEYSTDSLSGSIFYLTALGQYSFRTFEDQSISSIYSELNNEKAILSSGVDVGVIMAMTDHIDLSIGLTFFGAGEQYTFEDTETDSSFFYKNVYMQVGAPLKVRYTYGEQFQFFGYAGITPLNILSIRRTSIATSAEGIAGGEDISSIKQGFTPFGLMANVGIGTNYYFNYFGITLSGEYRRHLTNTYSQNTFKRKHNMYGIGLNLGLLLHI